MRSRNQNTKKSTQRNIDYAAFCTHLEQLTAAHPALTLRSDQHARSILELLSLHFWSIHDREKQAQVTEHWKERETEAKKLLNVSQKVIDAAQNLLREEAWIESRVEACGTGRHCPDAIGANSP